jgi:hypothetical protein
MRLFILFICLSLAGGSQAAMVADHTAVTQFASIPTAEFQQVRDQLNIFYGHTSHGGQLMTGLDMLQAQDAGLYGQPTVFEIIDDLGHVGDTSWVQITRTRLNGHPETNVVAWSWCAGMSDNTTAGVDIYLQAMNQLEIEYPGVRFIYMTGHLDGTGIDGNLYVNNNQVREYCRTNDKILFDFADIESWDPDGVYYPDESDACGWCSTWCASHDCPACDSCAHSHCFNCYLKGKAFWWLMASINGWKHETHNTDINLGELKARYR